MKITTKIDERKSPFLQWYNGRKACLFFRRFNSSRSRVGNITSGRKQIASKFLAGGRRNNIFKFFSLINNPSHLTIHSGLNRFKHQILQHSRWINKSNPSGGMSITSRNKKNTIYILEMYKTSRILYVVCWLSNRHTFPYSYTVKKSKRSLHQNIPVETPLTHDIETDRSVHIFASVRNQNITSLYYWRTSKWQTFTFLTFLNR